MHSRVAVGDIMSSPVVSVPPSMAVVDIAALLRDRRIGGVPVVAAGDLCGIVTESDLIHRCEIGTDTVQGARSWWYRWIDTEASARAYVKSHGRTARDVMSVPVDVVGVGVDVARLSWLFQSRRIGRLPVMENERLVGIVARADLVAALADGRGARIRAEAEADDETIRRRLLRELSAQPWWNGCWETFDVDAGVVTFRGVVQCHAGRSAARVAAENTPGVRSVVDERIRSSELREAL
jgi:CBS domain-containing protein